ncbi:MAG: tRNA (N6-threonylcarbamoyladenosine(37)-N6)-methyltransferase TrmO [Bdellovibrionaceae bacterium]|nr:tRNA (N6-threonylcarbamoyladenosine(37)-N6)-methyltransferase TrmO [Pseudobdellovibrionaceae bacterium]
MEFEKISDIKPIGYLESCYRDKFGTPRQPGLSPKAWSQLRLRADLQPEQALEGLESFSHVWLIFMFHQNKTARYHAKVHPPRLGGQSMGVFATRSPHRPNPIGLSLVELVRIEGDSLIFAGADLVDGTPILDIKPYLPEVEAKPNARIGWLGQAEQVSIAVKFLPEAEAALEEWQGRHLDKNIHDMIVDTLKLDPRPVLYRGYEQENSPYRSEHAFRLLEGDVHFRFESATDIQVFKILLMHN